MRTVVEIGQHFGRRASPELFGLSEAEFTEVFSAYTNQQHHIVRVPTWLSALGRLNTLMLAHEDYADGLYRLRWWMLRAPCGAWAPLRVASVGDPYQLITHRECLDLAVYPDHPVPIRSLSQPNRLKRFRNAGRGFCDGSARFAYAHRAGDRDDPYCSGCAGFMDGLR